MRLTTERARELMAAYEATGSKRIASEMLGMKETTFREHLRRAGELLKDTQPDFTAAVLPSPELPVD